MLRLVTYLSDPKPIILSVDDDDGCAFLIRRSLEDSWPSKRIEQFSDGHGLLEFLYKGAAGRKCEDGHSYIVLLDIRMPGLSGIDVLRRLRADRKMDAVPVIMFSTSDDPGEVSLCYQLGCSAFVRKPIDYQDFTQTMHRIADFIAMLLIPPLAITNPREAMMPPVGAAFPAQPRSPRTLSSVESSG